MRRYEWKVNHPLKNKMYHDCWTLQVYSFFHFSGKKPRRHEKNIKLDKTNKQKLDFKNEKKNPDFYLDFYSWKYQTEKKYPSSHLLELS